MQEWQHQRSISSVLDATSNSGVIFIVDAHYNTANIFLEEDSSLSILKCDEGNLIIMRRRNPLLKIFSNHEVQFDSPGIFKIEPEKLKVIYSS